MPAVFTTQVEIDTNGSAWIGGTTVKVTEVVADKLAHGWSPEEIHFQHPNLTLAQISDPAFRRRPLDLNAGQ